MGNLPNTLDSDKMMFERSKNAFNRAKKYSVGTYGIVAMAYLYELKIRF